MKPVCDFVCIDPHVIGLHVVHSPHEGIELHALGLGWEHIAEDWKVVFPELRAAGDKVFPKPALAFVERHVHAASKGRPLYPTGVGAHLVDGMASFVDYCQKLGCHVWIFEPCGYSNVVAANCGSERMSNLPYRAPVELKAHVLKDLP